MDNQPQMIVTNRHDRRKNLKLAKVYMKKPVEMKNKRVGQVGPPREGPKELPADMLAALKSGDEDLVQACIDRVLADGWDHGDLIRSFEAHRLNMLLERTKEKIAEQKKGNKILIV